MKKFKAYEIQFVGLKVGRHQYDYQIDNTFFELFEYNEFNNVNVKAELTLEKKPTMLELDFKVEGFVNVNCDVTNEPYDQPINGELSIVIKFGDEYNDENEELLIIPHGEYKIQVEQYIYEAIILSVPYKRIHPGVEDGTLNSEVLDKLEELAPKQKEEKDSDEEIDPRWNELKKLLNDNK
ncbi:YceD family protein [Mesonia maritima]|uniref:Uncharacterized metal-binding protein YceD (DUF177 family) n=1 Tax=Mesonia maritima TaxID=1793873 RepID=A0ABU1K2B9_9FLAO|nr:DUF177 domain-containing protein [Mesonia maritima]MDR6299756.1 uncharacterized metal-binding protein YceD (DUF177 family) [Mesonia maritima]